MGHPADENLPEVVPDSSPQALHNTAHQVDERDKYPVYYDNAPKFPEENFHLQTPEHAPVTALSPDGSVPWETVSAADETAAGQHREAEKSTNERRICGFSRRVFLTIIVVVLVVVAAAVGGGVGGAVASAKARDGSSAAASSSSATLTTSSTTTPPVTTTATTSAAAASITFLNNQTGLSGFAFQGFSQYEYEGNYTDIIFEEGFHDLGIDCLSYVWLPNGTDCCLTFCKNTTLATGYWCQTRYQNHASGPFPRIYIWCGDNHENANETCS